MLRLWRKKDGNGKTVWCASLQESGSRNTESFGEMSALFAFLQNRVGTLNPGTATVSTSGSSPEPSHDQ